jgi:signal transduction histidine kinase
MMLKINKLWQKLQTLKFRLMALITIILIVVVGLPGGFFIYELDKNYEEFSENLIETASQVVYQFIYDGMMKNDSLQIQQNLKLLVMDPSIHLVRIYEPHGRIAFSSNENEINKNVRDLAEYFDFNKGDSDEMESFVRKDNIYAHHHPIYVQKECQNCHDNVGKVIGILDVQAGFTSSDQLYVASKNLAIFGGIVIVVILWIVLNLLYHSQVESRLRIIMSGFDKLSKGDFSSKIKIPGRHELALLADKFNKMVENLKSARSKEDQFVQEKLERADRLVTLGEVAAEIAHEVNNPAGIILSRAEVIKEEILEQDSESAFVEDLNIIIQQTEKIAETTRSILHYSRKLPQDYTKIDLGELIQHSIRILQPRIKKSKVEIRAQVPDSNIFVWGNFSQLEQVFCNLINNSLDFIPVGNGIIQIAIEEEMNNGNPAKYHIVYQDNGPGIPYEFRDKVFTPFFTTKQDEKGTGLGLFIVKNILVNHKGSIRIEPGERKGACFVIDLEVYNGKS